MTQPQQPLAQSAQPPQQVLGQNRTFSPHPQQQQQHQQHTNSPTMTQPQIRQQTQPQAQRPSPDPRSPTFPAGNFSSSGHSTPGIRTPTSGLPSPAVNHFSQTQTQAQPQQVHQTTATTYATSFTPTQISQPQQQQNGRATPGNTGNQQRYGAPQQPNLSQNHPLPSPQIPQTNGATHAYLAATFSPNLVQPAPTSGTMGPPSNSNITKPMPQQKAYQYEMDDSLAGTGINLDEEEQYMNDYDTRVGFGASAPGGRGSFYGAGPMNQSAEPSQSKSQEEMVTEAADRAWSEAAQRYAASVGTDFKNGFVLPPPPPVIQEYFFFFPPIN